MPLRILILAAALSLSAAAQTTTTFVPLQSVWKYLDNGSNQGTAWQALGFNDAAWAQGAAELGYGDGDEATVVGYGPNASAKYITTYFRKSFTVTGAAGYTTANLRVRRDDGVVIYLNGTEVYRNTMPAGTVTSTTLASASIEDSGLQASAVNAALLAEGNNVLAVEIHQVAGTSSDISLDMDFTGTIPAGIPTANAQSVTAAEDTPKAITLTGTDPNGDPLSYSIVTPPAKGVLTGTPPAVTYTPNLNTNGADSFTFRVNDGVNNSPPATVSFTVTAVNDAPVGSGVSLSTGAAEPTLILLPVSDPDGDVLTIQTTAPAHGTLTVNGTTVTYTSALYVGPDSFTYTVSDGALSAGPFPVNITVLPFNEAPVASAGSATLDEDTPAGVTLVASDPESAPLTYAITVPPAHGTLSGTAPALIYTPALNFNGSDSFTWTASDASKTSAPAILTLTVQPVNDAPVAQSLSLPTETSTPAAVTLTGTDVENDALTFAVVTLPLHGTLSGTPPALTYTPVAGYTGTDSFTCKANDGALNSTPATVTINITAPALDNLVSAGAAWKYLADGSNQGTAWRAPAFNDSTWPQGPAQLGYGDGDEATVVPYGPDVNNRWVTTYFRREFQVPNPNIFTGALKLELLRDDGAIVYLNGTEVFRSNMPATTVAYNTLASSSIAAPEEQTFYLSTVSSGLLVPGRNVLAVEVHQGALNSADVSFDLKLYEGNPAITRGPYVQMTGPDRATVRWRTDVPTLSVLNYGLATNALTSNITGTVAKTEHEVQVTGLSPDTRYYYGAAHPAGSLVSGPTYFFTTHPPVNTVRPYRFWVLGDAGTATTSQTTVRDAFYTWNGAQYVDGVLLLGDNAYDTGTNVEYQTKFFDIYPTRLRNTTFWPCFGNHDASSASSATQTGPYYDSFTMPKLGEVGGMASGTKAYYSFDYGNIHFVCLDSEGTSLLSTGAMAQWLQADLAANSREWLIAFWHHPPYSKGGHDSDNPAADSGKMTNMRQVFVPILESYGVDLLLFGHEHAYFRSKFVDGHYGISSTFDSAAMQRQAGLGDPAVDGPYLKAGGPHNGAVYTTAGSSGKLDTFTRSMPLLAVHLNELGSVVLDISGRELTTRFLNNTGAVRDTFAIVHNNPPAALASTVSGTEDAPLTLALAGTDADGDALTYQVVTPPAVGTLTGTAPALTWTPPANFHGSATLQFRVSDGRVNSPPAILTLNIAPVNDAPFATAVALSTAEDTPLALTLAGSDVENDPLTFTVTIPPQHGTLTGTAPSLLYMPDANFHGPDSFAFSASDAVATSAPALIALNVRPVNDAPLAAAQSLATNEDTALLFTLTGTDADGDALTFAITTSPTHGSLTGAAPNLTFIPDADFAGSDSFAFTVSDDNEVSAPAVVAISIAPVNDLPLATAQAVSVDEDDSIALTLSGTDPENDPLTYLVTVLPEHGSLSGTAPALTYTPAMDYHGADSFAFIVHDGTTACQPAVLSITVAPVNDLPVAAAQALTVNEDTALPLTLTGTDADDDALTFTVTLPPQHGTLHGTAPALTYTPEENWNGMDSFQFTVSDGSASTSALVSIAVSAVNDAPVAVGIALSSDEDAPLAILLTGSDVDRDGLTFAIAAPPAHGTLTGIAPALTYTPDTNWNGTDTFTFTVSDGALTSSPAVVSISISPLNDEPVAVAVSAETQEDTAVSLTLSGTDADGDTLSVIITTLPAHGLLSGSLPDLLYTPDADWNGTDSFSYVVTDGPAVSEQATVTVLVAPVNDRPFAAAQSLTGSEDASLAITLAASDSEDDALTFTVTLPPAHGTLSGTVPAPIYTPDANWNGLDSFSFTASDGMETSLPVAITIEITPVNDAPAAVGRAFSTPEDTPIILAAGATDADGDELTFGIAAPPAHGAVTMNGSEFTYAPDENYNGPDSFTWEVTDGALVTAATVTITVTSVNDAPETNFDVFSLNEDQTLTVTTPKRVLKNDSDLHDGAPGENNNPLTAVLADAPPHAQSFTLNANGTFTYKPHANYHGLDSFTYRAIDSLGAVSEPETVLIAVRAVNDAPVAQSHSVTTLEDVPRAIHLRGADIDAPVPWDAGEWLGLVPPAAGPAPYDNALLYNITSQPQHGTLTGTAPHLIFTPAANYYGTDSFTFTASDGLAVSNVATVTITIQPDSDGDALPDTWEMAHFASLINTGSDDPDGDGQDNAFELIAGHDPADANSCLCMEPASPSATGGVFRLNHVRPGVRYVLQSSTDFHAWDRLSEDTYEVEGPGALYDERTDAGERQRCLYRVTVESE